MKKPRATPPPASPPKILRRETLELEARSIVVPPAFFRPRVARAELEDNALERDIRERGLDVATHPIRVRRTRDRYELVTGEPVLRACLSIDPTIVVLVIVQPPGQDDDASRTVARLADHAHRSELRTWQVAQELYGLTLPPHMLSPAEIARRTGYRDRYAANLIRLRRQLAPAIWQRWTEVGEALPVAALLDVCSHPPTDQAAELAEILSGRRARRRPRAPRVSRRQVERQLEALERELHRSDAWCDGAEHALRWVLGERPWRQDAPAASEPTLASAGRPTR